MTELTLPINKKHRVMNSIVVASTFLLNLITVIAYPELPRDTLIITATVIFVVSVVLAFFVKRSVPSYITVNTEELRIHYLFGQNKIIRIKDIFHHEKQPMTIVNSVYTANKRFDIHSFENDVKILDEICANNSQALANAPFNKTFRNKLTIIPYIATVLFFFGIGYYNLTSSGTYYGFIFLAGGISTIYSLYKILSFKGFMLHLTNQSLIVDHNGRQEYEWKDISYARFEYGEHHAITKCEIILNSSVAIELPIGIGDLHYIKAIVGACAAYAKYSD